VGQNIGPFEAREKHRLNSEWIFVGYVRSPTWEHIPMAIENMINHLYRIYLLGLFCVFDSPEKSKNVLLILDIDLEATKP